MPWRFSPNWGIFTRQCWVSGIVSKPNTVCGTKTDSSGFSEFLSFGSFLYLWELFIIIVLFPAKEAACGLHQTWPQVLSTAVTLLCHSFAFLIVLIFSPSPHTLPPPSPFRGGGAGGRERVLLGCCFSQGFPGNNSNMVSANQKGFQRSGWIRKGGGGAHALCSMAGDHYVRTKNGSGLEPDPFSQAHVLHSSQSV